MFQFSGLRISGIDPQGVITSVRSRGGSPPPPPMPGMLHATSRTLRARRPRLTTLDIASSLRLPGSTAPAGGGIIPAPSLIGKQLTPRGTVRHALEERMSLDYLASRLGQLLLIVFIAVTANFLIPR